MSNVKAQNDNSNRKTDIKFRAYQFSLTLISFVSGFPDRRMFWVFSNQLLRSGTSIGANIVEAKSSSSRREFIKYYEIALKSANETKYWLCLLRDSHLVERQTIEPVLAEAIELANMIGSSLLTLKGRRLAE